MLQRSILKIKIPKSPLISAYNSRFISTKHYDIIIVGGGLIGTTLACTLGKNPRLSDKKILLLEATKKQNYEITERYSNRVSALNPGSRSLLQDVGIWRHIESSRFGIIKEMVVWESDTSASIDFESSNSEENIAYVVENNVTLNGAYKELDELDNVEILYENKIKKCKLPDQNHGDNSSVISLENGAEFTSELLLGCDGARSKIREFMGAHYLSWNYDRMGVVATVEFEREFDNTTAFQKFLPNGPIALLPLNNKLSSLVWSTTTTHAKELLNLTDQEFVEALNRALFHESGNKKSVLIEEGTKIFTNLLNQFSKSNVRRQPCGIARINEESRAAFPLGFGHSSNYVQKGVALLGDAAHRVHPLAGQGVNLGFGDINCLNSVLSDAVYSGSELGNIIYLKSYETERQRHNVPTMVAIEGLHRIYSTEFPPLVLLRSIGVQTFNSLKPLKKIFQSHAAS